MSSKPLVSSMYPNPPGTSPDISKNSTEPRKYLIVRRKFNNIELAKPKSADLKFEQPIEKTEVLASELIKEEAKKNESTSFSVAKHLMGLLSITAIDDYLTPKIVSILSSNGICLANFVPQKTVAWLYNAEWKIAKVNNNLSSFLFEDKLMTTFIAATCEEVEFRWFVQKFLLQKLPKKIIEQISPNLAKLVDSTPARISRIAASALIFALIHAHALECLKGGGIAQLIGGLIYGTITEYTEGSIFDCIGLHFSYNILNLLQQNIREVL